MGALKRRIAAGTLVSKTRFVEAFCGDKLKLLFRSGLAQHWAHKEGLLLADLPDFPPVERSQDTYLSSAKLEASHGFYF